MFCPANFDNCVFILLRCEFYLHVLCSAETDRWGSVATKEVFIVFLNEITLGVRSVRIMVEHDQTANLGIYRELSYL